jgi:hypothetical protein
MRKLKNTLIIVAFLGLPARVGGETQGLTRTEAEYLREDVEDLMTVVFEMSDRAFVGDAVDPTDIIEFADVGNDFTLFYELPEAARARLGFGSGEATYRVEEDGVVVQDPLSFSFLTSAANRVIVEYELLYLGETAGGRLTDALFSVRLTATRNGGGGWNVEYQVVGDCWLGDTFCDFRAVFEAPGRPSDGILATVGDGLGLIDDPDVSHEFDMDIDWFADFFVAEGDLGFLEFFEEEFYYTTVM